MEDIFKALVIVVVQQQSHPDEDTVPGSQQLNPKQWSDIGVSSQTEMEKVMFTGTAKRSSEKCSQQITNQDYYYLQMRLAPYLEPNAASTLKQTEKSIKAGDTKKI